MRAKFHQMTSSTTPSQTRTRRANRHAIDGAPVHGFHANWGFPRLDAARARAFIGVSFFIVLSGFSTHIACAQRALFGAEAVVELPYLECASDGYQSAEATCRAKRELEAYPTWEIKGKLFSGLQPLDRLAELSDFTKPDLRIDMGGARSIKSADDGCSLSSEEDNCT